MATKSGMPICQTQSEPASISDMPPGQKTRWPVEVPPADIIETTKNLLRDIIRFVSVEEPTSVKLDQEGIAIGTFVAENADLVKTIKQVQDNLNAALGGKPHIDITLFKNWAATIKGFLLYARPKTLQEVKDVIKECPKAGVHKVNAQYYYYAYLASLFSFSVFCVSKLRVQCSIRPA